MEDLIKRALERNRRHLTFEWHLLRSADERVSWAPIIRFGNDGNRIGLTEDGVWAVGASDRLILLQEPRSFVATLPLLEKPRSSISQQLHEVLNSSELTALVEQVFPDTDIVRMGFEQGSDYWANLAIEWFIELSITKRKQLIDSLYDVSKAGWASQMVRQKADREIKKVRSTEGSTL